MIASQSGHADVVRLLLNNGAHVNSIIQFEPSSKGYHNDRTLSHTKHASYV